MRYGSSNDPRIVTFDVVRSFQPSAHSAAGFPDANGESTNEIGWRVTQKIIQEHGGNLALESKPGRPAKFAIYLPME